MGHISPHELLHIQHWRYCSNGLNFCVISWILLILLITLLLCIHLLHPFKHEIHHILLYETILLFRYDGVGVVIIRRE